ncbi:MAG: hypothetical protein LBM18_02540 [Oscillospiraceae bacterium]|nr:hypothetical protein [Oscillospiraceae bacterium]
MKRISVAILLLVILALAGCSPQAATESEEPSEELKKFPDIIVTSESGAVASVVGFGYELEYYGGVEIGDAFIFPSEYSYDAEKTLFLSAEDAPNLLTITGADYTVTGGAIYNLADRDVLGKAQPLDPPESGEALTIEAPTDVGEYVISMGMRIDEYHITRITYAFKVVVSEDGAPPEESAADHSLPIGLDGPYLQTLFGISSDTEGWFVGSYGPALGHAWNDVYLTHDGGKTWTEVSDVNEEYSNVITAADFADASVGFLCFRYYEENIGRIYRTTDGGATWERFEIPLIAEMKGEGWSEVESIEISSDGTGTLQLYIRSINEAESIIPLVTNDFGATWTRSE